MDIILSDHIDVDILDLSDLKLFQLILSCGYELEDEYKYLEEELKMKKETDGVTNEMVKDFAEDVIGTMDSLSQQFSAMYPEEDFDSLTQEQYEIFDDIVFTCASCGWNYELGEESGIDEDERICLDCEDEWEENM